jgi:hypothetical protein
MQFLFAHISWMPRYLGDAKEPFFSTHGWVLENDDAHEKWNFKPVGQKLFGYLPIRGKQNEDAPGEIGIQRLGAAKDAEFVDGVTVIWFANDPGNPKQAYIVGWYRKARVFREAQTHRRREYRISCDIDDATLLVPEVRKFNVPHVKSLTGQRLGYGYGQSSLWYADENTSDFLPKVRKYIDQIDGLAKKKDSLLVDRIEDAIDDLDDASLGNEIPGRRESTTTLIIRDNNVRRRVVARANGKCEHCGKPGFLRDDGSRFIEAHHIIHLAKQGPDTLENVIGLCPNHHREAHFGKNRERLEAELKAKLLKLRDR